MKKWYTDGLRFSCTRCGHCCTGPPGFVWITDQELRRIAERLGQPVHEVRALHTRIHDGRRSLREKLNGDCIFYEAGTGCTIYEVRPEQCRTFPFWDSAAGTKEAWERTQARCPGAGHGELISEEEITRRMNAVRI